MSLSCRGTLQHDASRLLILHVIYPKRTGTGLTKWTSSTRITITTSQLQRNDTQEPRWLYHDWRDATDRQQVFKKVFETLGQFVFDEKRQEQLPHARELRLTWTDGKAWTLRLDQGVGYWRVYNAREPFPFEQSVERQVARLRSCEIDVEAGYPSYPTYWYVGPV
jgi:DEAD/DEAH box helicase domain-containing protein